MQEVIKEIRLSSLWRLLNRGSSNVPLHLVLERRDIIVSTFKEKSRLILMSWFSYSSLGYLPSGDYWCMGLIF